MRTHDFLICYDITDPKRLARMARYLEQIAVRVQYSVFLYRGDRAEVERLADKLDTWIDPEVDDVRIYRVKVPGIRLGCAVALDDPFVIV